MGEWLAFIGMDQYVAKFAENEISGSILMDVTLEDLDYMSITVLGHRKSILKGAEELRKNKRVSADAQSQSHAGGAAGGGPLRTQSASGVAKEGDDRSGTASMKQVSTIRAIGLAKLV